VHAVDALDDKNEPHDIDTPVAIRLPLFILTVPYKSTADASDPIVIGFATVEPVPILMAPNMLLPPVPIFNIPSV